MKELIDKVRYAKSLLIAQGCADTAEYLKEAITVLEAMPAWVKCEERLPPEHQGTCAVLISDGSILTAWPTYWHGSRRDFAEWTFPIDYEDDMLVTHWMPLPAPPIQQEG